MALVGVLRYPDYPELCLLAHYFAVSICVHNTLMSAKLGRTPGAIISCYCYYQYHHNQTVVVVLADIGFANNTDKYFGLWEQLRKTHAARGTRQVFCLLNLSIGSPSTIDLLTPPHMLP